MTRLIAHLSDLHLLSRASGRSADRRTRLVSIGRALDPDARFRRAVRALRRAFDAGARHLVLTGDLTELGGLDELAEVAEALSASGFAPDDVTMVPGNHDRYGDAAAFERALEGVLAPWAKNASCRSSVKVVDLGVVALLPLDVTIVQSVARSRGEFSAAMADAIARRLASFGRGRRVAILQHHPPVTRNAVAHWFDGLVGAELERGLLDERVQVLHGHMHEQSSESVEGRPHVLLGAHAAVEDEDAEPRVSFYEATDAGLAPARVRERIAA